MSEDGYSSLSDIASGDDESDNGRRTRSTYTIKDALKAPRATTYTAQALFDQIVNGDIDLDPEYQRDIVWPEAKQVGLIDSLFRNFYIPPVIFSVIAHSDGSETKTCIDGKQRLTSIYRFMLGLVRFIVLLISLFTDYVRRSIVSGRELTLDFAHTEPGLDRDRTTGERYWYKDSSDTKKKRRHILPEKYRRLFANKQIVCVEYTDIGDRDEREIFQRVQLGMALTPAEKLGVLKSPRADFIRHIQSTFFKDDSSALISLAWDRSRGTDFRCLATILWCIDRYYASPANLVNTGSINQIESYLSQPADLNTSFKQNVIKAFETFQEMVASEDDDVSRPFRMNASELATGKSDGRKDKVSPIEFICICLLILIWRGKLSSRAMAAAIRDMRRKVRTEHVDIRMNSKVGKTMIDFLKGIKPQAYEQQTKKRKRPDDGDDDDDDDDEGEGDGDWAGGTNRLAGIRKAAQQHQTRTG